MAEPMVLIRSTNRNLVVRNRQQSREQQNDDQRSIPDLQISPMDFLEVANKLKTKLSLTVEELNTLKNGLIDNESNIDLVLNIHGALTGLIRELIGQDVKKQCAAAACCCNLALGDRKACMAISKAAGPYLIAALDSLSVELAGAGPRRAKC